MHLQQVVHVRSYLLHEHCDELHLLQLTEITILLLERGIVFVVVRQLLIHLMSRAMQIVWVMVWWCIIIIPFPQRRMKIRPFATTFEGRWCWCHVAQRLRNEHLCRQSILQFESSCFANSRHTCRDVAFCQSMYSQQIWHDFSMLLHYDVHVNDRVALEQASIVNYTLAGKWFVRAWRWCMSLMSTSVSSHIRTVWVNVPQYVPLSCDMP